MLLQCPLSASEADKHPKIQDLDERSAAVGSGCGLSVSERKRPPPMRPRLSGLHVWALAWCPMRLTCLPQPRIGG
jgi:hypothetical protein